MNIRQRLREATKTSHQELDLSMGKLNMFDSAEGYRKYLRCMQLMHIETIQSVRNVEQTADLPRFPRLLTDTIQNDLESIDSDSSLNQIGERFGKAVKPNQEGLREPSSEDWGRAYVIEGSVMGGKYMLQFAEEKLNKNYTKYYLENLSWAARERWPIFINAIESHEIDDERAIAAAIQAFDLMHDVVEKILSDSD